MSKQSLYISTASAGCPKPDGHFENPEQCDGYIECTDGVAVEKLCSDGLIFRNYNPIDPNEGGNCALIPPHFCLKGRQQPPNATENCPRQFGLFRLGDANHCGDFMNCANGVGVVNTCPEGLAFNYDNYQCDWPDEVTECSPEGFLQFTCPPPGTLKIIDEDGNEDVSNVLAYHKHPKACTKYFICDTGHPRLHSCGRFSAFNEETGQCDFYNHVKGCENEFKDIYYAQNVYQHFGDAPTEVTLEALKLNPFFKGKL